MNHTYFKIIALFLFITPVFISSQWQTYNTQTNTFYNDVSVVNANVIWAAGSNHAAVIRTTNSGLNWINAGAAFPDTTIFYHIFALDENTAWVSGGDNNGKQIFKTTDGGLSWTELSYPRKNYINIIRFFNASIGVILVDFNTPPNYDTCGFYITRDGGSNWYRSTNAPVIQGLVDNRISIVDSSFIVFTSYRENGSYALFRLTGGLDAVWNSFTLPSSFPEAAFFKDHLNGLATGLSDSVYRSTNGGQNWFRVNGGGFAYSRGLSIPGTNWATFSNNGSIKITYDFGSIIQTSNFVGYIGSGDAKDTNSIWFGGDNGRLIKYNIAFIGIHQISSEVPSGFRLNQNYPNPFNPTTKIEFELPHSADIEFAVYDAAGRQVYNITEQNKQPGKYSIDFNGTGLASGVYFYRLTSGDLNATKKMVIVK